MIFVNAFCTLCPFAHQVAGRVDALEQRVKVIETTFPHRLAWQRRRSL